MSYLTLLFGLVAAAVAQPANRFFVCGLRRRRRFPSHGAGGGLGEAHRRGDDHRIAAAGIDRVSALPPLAHWLSGRGAVCGRGGIAWLDTSKCGPAEWCCAAAGNATIVATGTGRRTLIEMGNAADAATAPAGGRERNRDRARRRNGSSLWRASRGCAQRPCSLRSPAPAPCMDRGSGK